MNTGIVNGKHTVILHDQQTNKKNQNRKECLKLKPVKMNVTQSDAHKPKDEYKGEYLESHPHYMTRYKTGATELTKAGISWDIKDDDM